MTAAQTQLYFRAWQAAASAHGWINKAGTLAAIQEHHAGKVWESPALTQVLTKIYDVALLTAAAADRDPNANDLRHACTAVALGRQASSKRFTNAEFDRVLALLRMLAGPTIKTITGFDDVEAGERKRLVYSIHRAESAYWRRLCADRFSHGDLDRLSLTELRQFAMTVRARMAIHATNHQGQSAHSQPLATAA